MPPALMRIERDEPFIRTLDVALQAFCEQLETLFVQCVENGWVKPKQKPEPQREKREPLPPLTDLVKSALREMNR